MGELEEKRAQQIKEQEAALVEAERAARVAQAAENLESEPAQGTSGALTCAVRLPDGRRVSRRFLKSMPLKQLFNFIDSERLAEPWTYNLVTQFPRRVLSFDTDGSFEGEGFTHAQEAFFL